MYTHILSLPLSFLYILSTFLYFNCYSCIVFICGRLAITRLSRSVSRALQNISWALCCWGPGRLYLKQMESVLARGLISKAYYARYGDSGKHTSRCLFPACPPFLCCLFTQCVPASVSDCAFYFIFLSLLFVALFMIHSPNHQQEGDGKTFTWVERAGASGAGQTGWRQAEGLGAGICFQ